MTRFASSRHARIVAVITPGEGLHVVASEGSRADRQGRTTLARPTLVDALTSCLVMLQDEPERFQRAAVVWHARWCTLVPALTLAEAQVALANLKALQGPSAVEGTRALRRLFDRHGSRELAVVLEDWIARR
jgi:hypothetical protein